MPIYTNTDLLITKHYSESFDCQLCVQLANNNLLSSNRNYMANRNILRCSVTSAEMAINESSDIMAAQKSLDVSYYLATHKNMFY